MKTKNNRSFSEQCYTLLCKVPAGKVTTYQELAHALGTKAYRAVGQAMRCNPHAPKVPCHRVVRSTGELGGYAGGLKKKIALLTKEGVTITRGKVHNLNGVLHTFNRR